VGRRTDYECRPGIRDTKPIRNHGLGLSPRIAKPLNKFRSRMRAQWQQEMNPVPLEKASGATPRSSTTNPVALANPSLVAPLLPAAIQPYITLPASIQLNTRSLFLTYFRAAYRLILPPRREVLNGYAETHWVHANPVALVDPSVVNAPLPALIRHDQPLANHVCSSGYHAICSVRCSTTTYR